MTVNDLASYFIFRVYIEWLQANGRKAESPRIGMIQLVKG